MGENNTRENLIKQTKAALPEEHIQIGNLLGVTFPCGPEGESTPWSAIAQFYEINEARTKFRVRRLDTGQKLTLWFPFAAKHCAEGDLRLTMVAKAGLPAAHIQVGNFTALTFPVGPESEEAWTCVADFTQINDERTKFRIRRLDTGEKLKTWFPFEPDGDVESVRSTMQAICKEDGVQYVLDEHATLKAQRDEVSDHLANLNKALDKYEDIIRNFVPDEAVRAAA